MPMPAFLDDRAVVAVSGADALPFLQGLITNDLETLAEGPAAYAALLTPQGKILFDFLVVRRDGAFLLDCRADLADALVRRLLLYRLRSKVTIEPRPDLALLSDAGGGALPEGAFLDPRLAELGQRAIVARDTVPPSAGNTESYLVHRLDCGVPEGADFGQDKIFALDADLDELHGVSFEKGCYVGQELTARMKHRGTARKRVFPVLTLDGSPLSGPDTPVTANTRETGTILTAYGSRGFALLRLDRLAEAGPTELRAAGTHIDVVRHAWLSA